MTDNEIIIGLTTIVVLGVGAQWIGRRLGFPSLLLLLPAGLAAGATGLVEPHELFGDALFPTVTLLVALLLFQSGLNLRAQDLPHPARAPVVRLVTIGLIVTFAGAAATIAAATDLPRDVAFVAGAILTVSGPTVVGPLLKVVRARQPVGAVLNWEGTALDPLGATLGVVVLNLVLASGRGGVHPILQMLGRLGLGAAVGLAGAALLVFVLSRFLVTDDMEASVALLVAVLCFAVAEVLLSEAGLFATVVLGVVAANQRLVPTARITGFGETLEVLVIGILFIVLGATVDVGDLVDESAAIVVVVAALVLVVRPVSVGLALIGTSLPLRDRALAAWMAPRGIVAAATAAQFTATLDNAGVDSSLLSPLAYGVILGTGIVYGLTAAPVARVLRVQAPRPRGVALVGTQTWVFDLALCLQDLGADVLVVTVAPPREVAERYAAVPMISPYGRRDAEVNEAYDRSALAEAVVASREGTVASLVVAALIERLGRSHVYVVPRSGNGTVGRWLAEAWTPQPFAPDASLTDLQRRVDTGAAVTPCPDGLPAGAIPLAAVAGDGTVDLRPGIGRQPPDGTVVALVGGDAG